MTYNKICGMYGLNKVDENKVNRIAESMKANGFVGCPILVWNDQLLTGSHRLAALKQLDEEGMDIYDWEVAEDVTDLVEDAFARFEEENGWQRDMDYSDLGWIFAGTWVEEYKEDIEEW